jgi:hypothetical protein
MQDVEKQYGAPASKLDPKGGQKHAWPTINRWTYPDFTVYFEKNRVIDAVANKADANEVGPEARHPLMPEHATCRSPRNGKTSPRC